MRREYESQDLKPKPKEKETEILGQDLASLVTEIKNGARHLVLARGIVLMLGQ